MSDTLDRVSYRAAIEVLDNGETFSRAHRLEVDAATSETMTAIRNSMRLSLQPAVQRVRSANPGREFKIEGGEFFTRSGDLILVMAVSRIS